MAVLAGAPVAAETPGLGLTAGSTGIGIESRHPLREGVSLRLAASVGQVTVGRSVRDTEFDVGVDLGGVSAMIDYHPNAGGLFLTAGVMHAALGFSAFRDDVTYQLVDGGTEYTGEVGFEGTPARDLAPVLGLGWRSAAPEGAAGWRWGIEGGVILTGRWRGSVTADTDTPMLGGLAQRFRTELAEANTTLNDELGDIPGVPYLRLAVERRF